MKMDRTLQRDILVALREVYPDSMLVATLPGFSQDRSFMGNLFYLQEHGLIAGDDIREPGSCRSMVDAQITMDGLDFIADDGGLPSILGRLKVKMDSDELVSALRELLLNGESPTEEGSTMHERLGGLDPDELKTITLQLLREAAPEQGRMLASLLRQKEG